MQNIKISLCMIVKNEEHILVRCLEAAKAYVDEIVVVDTGSSDTTWAIAQNYTDQIYSYTWTDDFSAARNYAIKKANNDWILTLDADEIVSYFDRKKVDAWCLDFPHHIGRLLIENPYESLGEKRLLRQWVKRLFNRNNYMYEGIIHEQLVALSDNTSEHIVPRQDQKKGLDNLPITLVHEGYTKDVYKAKKKSERNIRLLEKALKEHPKDTYLLYQLGKTWATRKEAQKAKAYFEQALETDYDIRQEYGEDLVISYGYVLLECALYNLAMGLEKYMPVYRYSGDFLFLMGLIYMNNAHFEKALSTFKSCIGKRAWVQGIEDNLPFYNMGVIHEVLGRNEKALEAYEKSWSYPQAQERAYAILEKLINQGKLDFSDKWTDRLLTHGHAPKLLNTKGVLALAMQKWDLAKKVLEEALEKDGMDNEILFNYGYTLLMTKEKEEARKVLKKLDKDLTDEKLRGPLKELLRSF